MEKGKMLNLYLRTIKFLIFDTLVRISFTLWVKFRSVKTTPVYYVYVACAYVCSTSSKTI